MTQIPHADKGLICPLHKADMSKVCHKCPFWTHIRGKHPQSNEEFDRWSCSIAFLPMLLLENAQQSRQTGAAVESLRNVVAKERGADPAEIAALINGGQGDNPKLIEQRPG